jgi:hypothetical protein
MIAELTPKIRIDRLCAEFGQIFAELVSEIIIRPITASYADYAEIRRKQPIRRQIVERGEQLSFRQIP